MFIAITGLLGSGKSTVFKAFLGTSSESKGNIGIVNVPDIRLEKLSKLYNPKKTTYSTINFEDCFAFDTPTPNDKTKLYERLRTMDALLFIVGAFQFSKPEEIINEAMKIRFEIILNDLDFVTKRTERLEKEIKLYPKLKAEKEAELALLMRMTNLLENERLLSEVEPNLTEQKFFKGYNILTTKPSCYVLNISYDDGIKDIVLALEEKLRKMGDSSPVMVLNAQIESEIASMESCEKEEFLKEFNIEKSGKDTVIKTAFEMLDLITFFTVGDDECRGWNIHRNDTALDAAGTIHSDLARGFIRAEVVECDTLLTLKSLAECRKAGKLRLEGKTYLVKDGEIVHIMFNV